MFQGVLFYAALLLNQMCKCWQQYYLHSICDAVLIELDCSINGKHIFCITSGGINEKVLIRV